MKIAVLPLHPHNAAVVALTAALLPEETIPRADPASAYRSADAACVEADAVVFVAAIEAMNAYSDNVIAAAKAGKLWVLPWTACDVYDIPGIRCKVHGDGDARWTGERVYGIPADGYQRPLKYDVRQVPGAVARLLVAVRGTP